MPHKNTKTVQITDTREPRELSIMLEKLCYLRSARKNGDIETINHTQLGKLNMYNIKFVTMIDPQK